MTQYVNLVSGVPDFASLPAGKIIRYPLETRDMRPFAQTQLALSPDALYVRLTAFEAQPDADSRMLLILEGGEKPLVYSFSPSTPSGEDGFLRLSALHGEDLQGIYWGVCAVFNRAELEKRIGRTLCTDGTLRGNVFKVCATGERRHCGCLFESAPVWNETEAENASLGSWSIVDY